ncbi:SDR family NAD(P)-dependent oxidoreductase [Mucilaginibacter ginsenosidivorax]|uniref:SDR family oxidoreductase n=1 Tax=Mucilaginibacter ginsenosidivorax TaxID=862126 RepID=A0A5B8VUE5_9SPHI|nr:SDR family oxidoreductase [Mucilaginibacter ginsenosidivorax]QEC74751.1 SDR family oxidoreductase [Mucilaginibacter ginsenosidivorax]
MENQKTALITGGTSGIGKELAKLFAKDEYNLIIVARDQAELDTTAAELRSSGISVQTIAKDLSDMEQAKVLCKEITTPVDVLVNDAGMGVYGLFKENDLERELGIIHLNICATVILTKHFVQQMAERGGGKILNLGSVAGKLPGPWQAVYHATKAFVLSFTAAIREELKDSGITFTALMPGATDTDFFNKAGMLDSKIAQDKEALADAADVAIEGYEALMAGKDRVIAGWKNSLEVHAANLMPDSSVAHSMYEQQKPVEQEQQNQSGN